MSAPIGAPGSVFLIPQTRYVGSPKSVGISATTHHHQSQRAPSGASNRSSALSSQSSDNLPVFRADAIAAIARSETQVAK
mgnify:CR=1 FL=1